MSLFATVRCNGTKCPHANVYAVCFIVDGFVMIASGIWNSAIHCLVATYSSIAAAVSSTSQLLFLIFRFATLLLFGMLNVVLIPLEATASVVENVTDFANSSPYCFLICVCIASLFYFGIIPEFLEITYHIARWTFLDFCGFLSRRALQVIGFLNEYLTRFRRQQQSVERANHVVPAPPPQPPIGSHPSVTSSSLDNDERLLCVICQVEEKKMMIEPCRHICLCRYCSVGLTTEPRQQRRCPICRGFIGNMQEVFL